MSNTDNIVDRDLIELLRKLNVANSVKGQVRKVGDAVSDALDALVGRVGSVKHAEDLLRDWQRGCGLPPSQTEHIQDAIDYAAGIRKRHLPDGTWFWTDALATEDVIAELEQDPGGTPAGSTPRDRKVVTLASLVPGLVHWGKVPPNGRRWEIVGIAYTCAIHAVQNHFSESQKKELSRLFRTEYNKSLLRMINSLQQLDLTRDRRSHWQDRICELWRQVRNLFYRSLKRDTVDQDRFDQLFNETLQMTQGMAIDAGLPVELSTPEQGCSILIRPMALPDNTPVRPTAQPAPGQTSEPAQAGKSGRKPKGSSRPDSKKWSKGMTKNQIVTALHLTSVYDLNQQVKAGIFTLQMVGTNRQKWRVLLDGLDEEAKNRLAKM